MAESNATIFNNWKEFIYVESEKIIQENLCTQKYDSLNSKEWANSICQQIIEKLSTVNKNFKYITNCIILATGGNGMDLAGVCYWDNEMDGSTTVKWESKELICIVNIYGIAV